ncbi:MAG TPA: PadR family transcriptional regulator [Gemmatimonadales bacterium]|nr:PadR family transcriptional regulator [Gemmatimonadales bacterium]
MRDPWDWDFSRLFEDFGKSFAFGFGPRAAWRGRGGYRHRRQVFESGELRYVILGLLRERPRHGYDVIKALEERFGGFYSPSPGTVYPVLQMLEDQGMVRIVETDGKKVYHITPEGERFLDESRDTISSIFERVREAMEGVVGGAMGDLHRAFVRLGEAAYGRAWRAGPESERTRRIVEILRRAAEEIENAAPGAR